MCEVGGVWVVYMKCVGGVFEVCEVYVDGMGGVCVWCM